VIEGVTIIEMLRLCLSKIFLLLMILAVPASMVENVGGKEGDCLMDAEQGACKRGSCSDQGGWKCTHEVRNNENSKGKLELLADLMLRCGI
jgi:hypothetical protein